MDVWLGNSRGTLYSHEHTYINLNDSGQRKVYWSFSWADMGKHDVPTTIDFIRQKTGALKVAYVGYSQGTIQMFYGMTTMKEYFEENISVFIALAPCALIGNTNSALKFTADNFYWAVETFTDFFEVHNV